MKMKAVTPNNAIQFKEVNKRIVSLGYEQVNSFFCKGKKWKRLDSNVFMSLWKKNKVYYYILVFFQEYQFNIEYWVQHNGEI